jgi:carbon monoxide dehydrogenase subunit G
MKLESKITQIAEKDEKIFNYLTDFNNFKHLIPADKVKNWESDRDSCRFTIDMIGETGFKIVEKEPFKLIKLSSIDQSKFAFKLWIQLKDIGEHATAAKLTMEVELNPMIEMMAKKPLQGFLDTLAEQIAKIKF